MRGAAADMQVTLRVGSGRLSRHIVTGTLALSAEAPIPNIRLSGGCGG